MKYTKAIEESFTVKGVSGAEYQVLCPWHADDEGKLYVNGMTGLYICFAGSCGIRGSIARNGNLPDPSQTTTSDVRDRIRTLTQVSTQFKTYDRTYLAPYLAPGAITKADPPNDRALPTWQAWEDRGVTPQIQAKLDLGVDMFDNGTLIIPVKDRFGRIYGVVRRFMDGRVPKYRYPTGLHMGQFVFGLDVLGKRHQKVAVVEGSIDAARCWSARVPAIAVWGCRMTQEQEFQIRKAGIRTMVLMLDNDDAGSKGMDQIEESITWCHISRGQYRPYWNVKDPGELSAQRIRKMFHSA